MVKLIDTAEPTRIKSVSRAAEVLRYVASAPERGRSVNEIAETVRRPVTSTYHLLNTLVHEGLLSKDAARRYHLGLTVGVLGAAYARRTQPPEEFVEKLRSISAESGESTYLSAWRDGEIVVLASVPGSHAVRVSELEHGYAGHAHARASGKLLLAQLEPDQLQRYLKSHPLEAVTRRTVTSETRLFEQLKEVRNAGYAVDVEEFKDGVACVSGPALHEGTVVGAFTISCPIDRFRKQRSRLIATVLEAEAVPKNRGGMHHDH